MFERLVNSKFYSFLDQLAKVVWINLLTLFFLVIGLVLFTGGPALLAGIYSTKLLINKYEGPIFPVFMKAFKEFYKKATLLFIVYFIFITLLIFNIYFFFNSLEVEFSFMALISFVITLLLIIITVPAMFHSLLTYSCYKENGFKSLLVDGFKLSIAFIVRGLILIVGIFLLVFGSLLVPILLVIFSVFGLLLLVELVIFRGYDKTKFFNDKGIKKAMEFTIGG